MPRLILIVEDDEAVSDSLAEVLRDEGYDCLIAGTGEQALAVMASQVPDVILLDIMMPEMDGYQFRAVQLADRRWAHIPTFVLTAGAIDERLTRMELAGWLRKPMHLPSLLTALERALSGGVVCPPPNSGEAQHIGPLAHPVAFYEDDGELAGAAARFLADGLANGDGVVIVATAAHRAAISDALSKRGVDLEILRRAGRFLLMDAQDTLRAFMFSHGLSEGRFTELVGAALAQASQASPAGRVRAYGEMVDLLWLSGDVVGALKLEDLWNNLRSRHPFALMCAYSARLGSHRAPEASVRMIRDVHTAVAS